MDELDIYEDLEEFDSSEKLKLKIIECNLLSAKYSSALKQIEELQLDRQGLQKKIENIEKSFSSLLTTARTEINRKTTQIAELRKELDDVCFRRGVRGRPAEILEYVVERKKEPHNLRHGYEKEPNSYDRISSRSRYREEKAVRLHKSSERDYSRPRNPLKESEEKSSTKHQISSSRNSLKDESTKSSHSTSKYNEGRHRDHTTTRKEERLNDRRREEKWIDHRKQEKSNDHRKQEKSNSHRKEEKINMHNDSRNTFSKSSDKASRENSKSESKSGEKHSPNKTKTQSCLQNKNDNMYISLPELDLSQAILESTKQDRVLNTPLETAIEIKHSKIERRISLSSYRNRINSRRSESEDNVNISEGSGTKNVGNVDNSSVTSKKVEEIINTNEIQLNESKSTQIPTPDNKVETTLAQNKKGSPLFGKREIFKKRTFEDVLFDELVFEENQNADKNENHESEDECLYAGLEMENVSEELNKADQLIESSKICQSDGTQHKIQKEVLVNEREEKAPNSKTAENIIVDTSKSKVSFDSTHLDPESLQEIESSKEDRNILKKIDSQTDKIVEKQSSKNLLSFITSSDQDKLKTFRNDTNSDILLNQNSNPTCDKESENELNISKEHRETNSSNKGEESLSSSNIFDTSFDPENNKSESFISPYFGDHKTSAKYTNNSQLPREHNNSIENEMAIMFKESPDQLKVLPPTYQSTPSLKADVISERNFQNKAKEMFDLYLASPTNVIPSEIENSKDRSPPNPTITGMKKRKSSTPRKSPGLLNGRGLKLVGHRIEGFEPGIRGEKALEASKLKNALFKEILGNETTAEERAFRKNLQESSDEKDSHLNNEDVLEAQEENKSQTGEGSNKALTNEEGKIEKINDNDSKQVVGLDCTTELSNENEKSADDNKVLKALECLENISDDDDLFSDISSDFNGKQSTKNPDSEEHQGQQEIPEHVRSNEINCANDKSADNAETVKMEESKDLDEEEIPATADESQGKMPSKIEDESFTKLSIEDVDEEVVGNPIGVVSDYNNRTSRAPFCSDKICVVIPLSTQDSIKSRETDFKKSPTTYSPQIKIAERKPHLLKSQIKEDIQEDEVNIENTDLTTEDLLNEHTSEPNRTINCKEKHLKKYVEDFCKTIESVEEETVSDSIRSQTSDQGTACSLRKRQSIVTFADLLKLPNREKEANHTDSSKIIKTQSRTKINLKSKRTRVNSENRKSIYIKSKDSKFEGFESQRGEGTSKNKHKSPSQSSDVKKSTRHSKKIRGVFVRSLYVNSTQEKDIKILKKNSSVVKEVSVDELLLKSGHFQSTRNLFKRDNSPEPVIDVPIKSEPAIKDSPPEDIGQKYSSPKPKMPLIRTISQKRRGNILSPKKKRRKIEIFYSKEEEPSLEHKVEGTSTGDEMVRIDRENGTVETPNCPALTKENIRKMLASLNEANSAELKGSEDEKVYKENNKPNETTEIIADKENNVKNPSNEVLSAKLETPFVSSEVSVSSEKYNLVEEPVPTSGKNEEQNHRIDNKNIKETLIELFGDSPMPTPMSTPMPTPMPTPVLTPMSTPMPTPKRRSSDNDEVQCTFEQLNATNNNNNQQDFEMLNDKEFKQQTEEVIQHIEPVEKSKEFEERTVELSFDKNEIDKNIDFIFQEKEKLCDISEVREPSPKVVKFTESSVGKSVSETDEQEQIQPTIEEDKENLSSVKRRISCLSNVCLDESKTESKITPSLNNSGTDLKNISTISTSSADYRIEAVNSDVVNVFITRKRRKRKA